MDMCEKVIGNAEDLQYLLPAQSFHSCWSSPEALARYVEAHGPGDCWDRDNAYKSRHGEDFYGTKDMEEALLLAQDGWKEGAEKIQSLRSLIQARTPQSPRVAKHGVAGATPNVARAVAGDIMNMRQPILKKSRQTPIITLVCNMCCNGGTPKEAISNRAAAIAAVIDVIENQGFACEVISTALTRGYYGGEDGFSAATSVMVKRSDQAVDLGRLAFGLGHAAMFRRLIFADWQLEPTCQKGLGSGLGYAKGAYKEEDMAAMREKGIFFIPSAEYSSEKFKDEPTTADKGVPYIIQVLRKQGCAAFPKMTEEENAGFKMEDDDYPRGFDDDERDEDEEDDDC